MPFCTSYDGVRLFYTDTAAAAAAAAAPHPPRPVLFLTHGFASSHRLWDAQLPRLASAGYRCVRWDMRGHGQSGKPPANDDARHPHRYAKWSQVHDMRAVLAACGLLGGPAVILVAHSMGGMDSLLFTLTYSGDHITDVKWKLVRRTSSFPLHPPPRPAQARWLRVLVCEHFCRCASFDW